METVTVPVELLEQLVTLNTTQSKKVEEMGLSNLAEYYEGRASAYGWILENYRQ